MRISWRRLLVNPTTRIESQEGGTTVLRVDGLVCETVCAVRAKEALAAMPGVKHVRIDYDAGIATIEGAAHDAVAYESALTGAVAGKPLRRLLEHVAQLFKRDDGAGRRTSPPTPLPGVERGGAESNE